MTFSPSGPNVRPAAPTPCCPAATAGCAPQSGVPAADALAAAAALHRDASVVDDGPVTSVDLAAYRAASDMDDLELGQDEADDSAA